MESPAAPLADASDEYVSFSIDHTTTAGFGTRFLGRLVDWIFGTVTGVVAGLFAGIICAILAARGSIDADWLTRLQSAGFAENLGWGLLGGLAYHTICEGIGGATVGKLVIGYRVVDVRHGGPASLGSAFIRSIGYFVDSLFFGLVAHTAMKASGLNQRYGDQWAKTTLVKASTLGAGAKRAGGLVAIGIFGGALAQLIVLIVSMVIRAAS